MELILYTDLDLRSKIIEMKQSGIEMTTFVRLLAVWNSWTLYEVLNVHLQKWIR